MEVLILVISFVILLGIGVPIAWSIGISSILTMLVSIPTMPAFTTVAQRMATGLDSFALLAIPFFILAGQIMNKGGIAKRLIAFAKALVGSLPGGLAHINIIAAMLFGAISGSAVAAASAIGSFMTDTMEKEGYSREFSAAVNITSSTTGLVIPPSNILIVYSLASGGVSIAALFVAGYIPGILTGLALMLVAAVWAKRHGYAKGARSSFGTLIKTFIDAFPSLLAPDHCNWGHRRGNFHGDRSLCSSRALLPHPDIYLQGDHVQGPSRNFPWFGWHDCDRDAADRHFHEHVVDHGLRKHPADDYRIIIVIQRQQDCHLPDHQPDPVVCRGFHGHDPGCFDFHSNISPGRNKTGNGPGALRDHDGAEPMHWALYSAGRLGAVCGCGNRTDVDPESYQAIVAAVRRDADFSCNRDICSLVKLVVTGCIRTLI